VGFGAAFDVVEDRPSGERRFHVAEGGFGAGEQNIDAPELVSRQVLAIGLDQIAAIELFGLGMAGRIELTDDRCGLRIMGEAEVAGDAGIAFLQSSDRLVDLCGLDKLSLGDTSRQPIDVGAQAVFLLGADGAVLGDALLAAAQHVGVVPLRAGLDLDRGLLLGAIERRGLAQHRREAFGVLEVGKPAIALRLPACDHVVELALLDLGDVVVKRHAAVDHHGRALGEAGALGQAVEHGGKRGAVLGVSSKHLVGDRKAFAADHQADHDLLAVRSVVARIAALGFVIAPTLALEVGRREIVQIDCRIEIEQAALALDQRRLDRAPVRMQLVEHLIERVFLERVEVGAEDVGERRAPDPVRHGVLRARRDQSIERHRAGQCPHRGRQLAVAQDVGKPQALPELVANMDRTRFPMVLGRNPRRIDLDQSATRRQRRRLIMDAVIRAAPGAARPHSANDVGDLAVVRIEQIALAHQRVLDLAGELQPLLARSWAQITKRANRPLAGSLRRLDRFHQQVIRVSPALVGPRRLADVHAPIRMANHPDFKGNIADI